MSGFRLGSNFQYRVDLELEEILLKLTKNERLEVN